MNKDKIGYLDASKLTGLPLGTLYSMVCRKQIPHYRLGPRLIRFSTDELIEWLKAQKVEDGGKKWN